MTTDTPGGDPGTGAGGGAASAQPQMSRETAAHRKAELMGDREWGARYINGGSAERAEMDALNQALAVRSFVQSDVVSMDEHIATFKTWADFSPEVEQQIREGRPVTSYERGLAEQRKAAVMKDRAS